ncbi:MAG: FtsX-like permease family protein [Chlamydiota bacterium]
MFELSIALKYLIPRKKHLSVTLIAMMSLAVISLVVWLLLVFLSVTEGMERTWLKKLTDLNAPLRITPKQAYFSSYYHQIDSISNTSNFSTKTLGEKLQTISSDPYDSEEDSEIPAYWPKPDLDAQGFLIDPVKGLSSVLGKMQEKHKTLLFQDYEMSGAMLKIQMLRNHSSSPFSKGQESMNFLTQVSYLATPPLHPKTLSPLLLSPTAKDINHLFFLAGYRMDGFLSDSTPRAAPSSEGFQEKISYLLNCIEIKTIKTAFPTFRLPLRLLPENVALTVYGVFRQDTCLEWFISDKKPLVSLSPGTHYQKGTLHKKEISFEEKTISLANETFFSLDAPLIFSAQVNPKSIAHAFKIKDIQISVQGSIQGNEIKGLIPWADVEIASFALKQDPLTSPPWAHAKSDLEMTLPLGPSQEVGVLLPKAFQENGVLLGDKGYLSYASSTASAFQEMRSPIFVAGFYDPGILSVGNKCLLVPPSITRSINSCNTSFTFDKIALNGFQIWVDDLNNVTKVQQEIEANLEKEGLANYWQVTSFKEYDFAKDLLQQFQSDRYLFSLVGIIILLVACCNIVSFLILLVNDKKKEIAILQSMGASKKSIACIFGLCGIVVGIAGCALGILAGVLTIKNIDTLVRVLSALQGHDAFLQTFYGSSLPSTLSSSATLFISIATPILSIIAGLIPAIKACRLHPSSILRSES